MIFIRIYWSSALLSKRRNGIYIIRCRLIYKIIEPVGVQQVGAGAPGHRRLAAGVIAGEVVLGDPDVRSGGQVPYVLIPQGVPVILRVAHEEDLPALVGLDGVDPGLRGGGFRQ